MSAIPRGYITPQQYLATERTAEFKSEYYRGEVFAMAGASYEHTRIKDNFAHEVRKRLDGNDCAVLTSDMRVKVPASGLYTYPDVVIAWEKPRFEDNFFDILLNPQIIIEVLSDSTEKYDRGGKFGQYRQIDSLQEYLLIAQDQPLAERYARQPDGTWVLTVYDDISKTLEFATLSARIPLTEIYSGITFPESVRK